MLKWKLMLGTVPFVLAAVAIKLVMDATGFRGVVDFGDVAVVLTGAVFIIGFMLAGTMADYKESEKVPGDLACSLEMIEDMLEGVAASKKELDLAMARQKFHELTTTIREWLYGRRTQDDVFAALHEINAVARLIDRVGGGQIAFRIIAEVHTVRRLVTRVGTIIRTSFLPTGYALLEVLVVSNVLLVLMSRFKSPVAEFTVLSFVTLVYSYMVRLIHDIDHPFEYSAGGRKGASEVDLTPLSAFLERSATRLAVGSADLLTLPLPAEAASPADSLRRTA